MRGPGGPLNWVDPHVICISQSRTPNFDLFNKALIGLDRSHGGSAQLRGPPDPSSQSHVTGPLTGGDPPCDSMNDF